MFLNCLHKVNWVTLIVQEMQKSMKGGQKCFCQCSFCAFSHVGLVTHRQSMVWVILVLKPLCSVCSGVAISSDTKYHIPTILQVLIKLKSVKIATLATVVWLHTGHVKGENSPGSRYVVKALNSQTILYKQADL